MHAQHFCAKKPQTQKFANAKHFSAKIEKFSASTRVIHFFSPNIVLRTHTHADVCFCFFSVWTPFETIGWRGA